MPTTRIIGGAAHAGLPGVSPQAIVRRPSGAENRLNDMQDSRQTAMDAVHHRHGPSSSSTRTRTPRSAGRRASTSFVQQIRDTADKLLRDGAIARGDVKLLNTAWLFSMMRYAFKGSSRRSATVRKVTVFGSARLPATNPAYQQAVEFSRRVAQAGWMVITGAASGIMEAGHVGAGRDKSFGVNILLPFEQDANPIIRGDLKLMHLKYFFTRKLLFVKEADAVALFPGGFGTQDEGFEVLTLVQTGKSPLIPIIMVDEPGGDYWVRCG